MVSFLTYLRLLPWHPSLVAGFLKTPVVRLPTTPVAKTQAGANLLWLKDTVRRLVLYKDFVSFFLDETELDKVLTPLVNSLCEGVGSSRCVKLSVAHIFFVP